MKESKSQEARKLERDFTEGITAMSAGLTMVILGATVLGLPAWSAALFIPFGIYSYIRGLRAYNQSRRAIQRK